MTHPHNTACVILAGGAGKRMGSARQHKVCFPVLGRPAIVRAIDGYKKAGLKRFIVVVGQKAHDVMATVSAEHPDVAFAFQSEAKGTGHAALVGCHSLAASAFTGNVLITMGDKLIDPKVVQEMVAMHQRVEGASKSVNGATDGALGAQAGAPSDAEHGERPALTMVTQPLDANSSAGRVLIDGDDAVVGIVEKVDLEQADRSGRPLRVGDRRLTRSDIDALRFRANGSLYLFQFPQLWEALNSLRPDNEQGELYLTDTVGILRGAGRPVRVLDVPEHERIMAFNTPAELLAIEEAMRDTASPGRVRRRAWQGLDDTKLKPAGEWRNLLQDADAIAETLWGIYGDNAEVTEQQRCQMLEVVERFAATHGDDRRMILCRAPGRINLMGRHVEHRGGDVNVMAISRETLVAAAPREDDSVNLHNVDPSFPDRTFRISQLLQETSWENWVDFIDSHTVKEVLEEAPGDWSHYARAPLLRLQHESPDSPLCGMDCVVGGNIPMGAGLSSSSALVVAFAEAAIAFNGLDIEMGDFIDLCGEGEWFVGSRGGNGDHAAIRVSRIGAISQLGFFPFAMKRQVAFPRDLRLVIADSRVEAKKSAGAKDAFNHRIASYKIGQMLLQKHWPPAAGIEHLRDLLPERLKVGVADIYHALTLLPERPTRADLRALFDTDEEQSALDRIFSSHADIGPYDLRGVILYGLAECQRSARFCEHLAEGDLAAMRDMMAVSHDGDRVAEGQMQSAGGNGNQPPGAAEPRPFTFDLSDSQLRHFAAESTDLAKLPGAYACSTPEIDGMVDLIRKVPGVVGTQLSGAGLGGCVMTVVEANAVAPLTQTLESNYYQPQNKEPRIFICQPVEGAGLLETAPMVMDGERT